MATQTRCRLSFWKNWKSWRVSIFWTDRIVVVSRIAVFFTKARIFPKQVRGDDWSGTKSPVGRPRRSETSWRGGRRIKLAYYQDKKLTSRYILAELYSSFGLIFLQVAFWFRMGILLLWHIVHYRKIFFFFNLWIFNAAMTKKEKTWRNLDHWRN